MAEAVMPDINLVVQVIRTLHHDLDTSNKEKASAWLGELQRSVFAWKVSDELLFRNEGVEVNYFAAQTMRSKIQYSFHELPSESHESLRDSLLQHLKQVNQETHPVIITQLCLALADLALQMASWRNPVSDILTYLAPADDSNSFLLPPLDILRVLPEELSSRSLRLGDKRREALKMILLQSVPDMLHFLLRCLAVQSLRGRVLLCLSAWMTLSDFPSDLIASGPLLEMAFSVLNDLQSSPSLHEAATECICSAVVLMEDHEKHTQLAHMMVNRVLALTEVYHMAVAHEDVEKCSNLCRVISELAESLLESMVQDPSRGLAPLEAAITCMGHHDYEVAEVTFNLWYRLSEEVFKYNDDCLNVIFQPYVERLLTSLCRHLQMEPDHDGVLDEGDDFASFRHRASELIKDVVFIVGSSTCFRQMVLILHSPNVSWEASEAALFVMHAVARNVPVEDEEVVPHVIDAILNLSPEIHVAVRFTSIQVLGELCEWLERHSQKLEEVFTYLLNALGTGPPLGVAASVALQSICNACRDHMTPHAPKLFNAALSLDSLPHPLPVSAILDILRAVATIIGRLPTREISVCMDQLCLCHLQPIMNIVKEEEEIVNGSVRGRCKDPTAWLDRLSVMFRHLNPLVVNGEVHPCKHVLGQLWPVMSEVMSKYEADSKVIERTCRCVRFALRCVGSDGSYLLQPMAAKMVELYEKHRHPCCLYLGSVLVDEYGSDENQVQLLLGMLHAFLPVAFTQLQELHPPPGDRRFQDSAGATMHPETLEDLYRLATRFVQRCPLPLLESGNGTTIQGLVNCAIASIAIEQRDAHNSISKFLNDLLDCGLSRSHKEDFPKRRGLVLNLMEGNGQNLTTAIVQTSVNHPSYLIPDLAEVLFCMIQLDRAKVCGWLEEALKSLPSKEAVGVTHQELVQCHRRITMAEAIKDVSRALKDFARLYR